MDSALPAVILLDIEGTVGAISFVKRVMYPWARARLSAFVQDGHLSLSAELAEVRRLALLPDDAPLAQQIRALEGWSDADQKIGPLKDIQGRIWESGFRSGELQAHLYPEVVGCLRRWHAAGARIAVYSSGSVQAQRLYFAHTVDGDLSPLISGWFDTKTGPKQEPASYLRIADALSVPPATIRFFSDQPAELLAAKAAGYDVVQVRRPDEPGAAAGEGWRVVAELEEDQGG